METQPSLIAIFELAQQNAKELASLRTEMREGFDRIANKLDQINDNIKTMAGDIIDCRTDLSRLRKRVQTLEDARTDPNAPTTRI